MNWKRGDTAFTRLNMTLRGNLRGKYTARPVRVVDTYERPLCVKCEDDNGHFTTTPDKLFTGEQVAEFEAAERREIIREYREKHRDIELAVLGGALTYRQIADEAGMSTNRVVSVVKRLMRLGMIPTLDRTEKANKQ